MRIAVIGGSFNPVHIGHLALADEVRSALGYDRVTLIPAATPPHKTLSGDATSADRVEMLALAAEGVPWLEVDTCEIDRGGISWTIDTLEFLLSARPDIEGKIGLVIGRDLVAGFPSWRRAADIADLAELIVARRPSAGYTDIDDAASPAAPGTALDGMQFPFRELSNLPLPVSSSGIRSRIRAGKSWRYLVPDAVYRYIEGHGLYDGRTT